MIFNSAKKHCFSSISGTMEKESSDEKKSTIPPVSHKEDTSVTVESPNASVKEDTPDIQALDMGKVSISEREVLKCPSSVIEEKTRLLRKRS